MKNIKGLSASLHALQAVDHKSFVGLMMQMRRRQVATAIKYVARQAAFPGQQWVELHSTSTHNTTGLCLAKTGRRRAKKSRSRNPFCLPAGLSSEIR